jgi:hypothetical protein
MLCVRWIEHFVPHNKSNSHPNPDLNEDYSRLDTHAMSEPSPTDYIAVAFLVDSSLAVASDWNLVLKAYIAPMIRRLGEVHSIAIQQVRSFRQSVALGLTTAYVVPSSNSHLRHRRYPPVPCDHETLLLLPPTSHQRITRESSRSRPRTDCQWRREWHGRARGFGCRHRGAPLDIFSEHPHAF